MHRILLRGAVIDVSPDLFAPTRDFWAAALDADGAEEEATYPEFTSLPGSAALMHVGFQRLQDGAPRVHLDIESDDIEAEVERLIGLGAELVQRAPEWVVLKDPAGLLLCVLPPECEEFDSRAREVG